MSALVLALAVAAFQVEVRASSAYADFTGSMTFDEGGEQGNRVEFSPDARIVPALEVNLWDGHNRLFLKASRLAFDGDETLQEDRRWNDTVFLAGETVDMRFEWNRVRLGIELGGAVAEDVHFLFAGALRYDAMRFRLESNAQGKDDEAFGVVSIDYGAVLRAAVSDHLALSMGLSGIYTDPFDDETSGFAGYLEVRWMPCKGLAFTVGLEGESLAFIEGGSADRNRISYEAVGVSIGAGFSF